MQLGSLATSIQHRIGSRVESQAVTATRKVVPTMVADQLELQGVKARSPIGERVRQALKPTNERNIPLSQVQTTGSLEEIWLKGHSEEANEITDRVLPELAKAQHEIRLQTFVIDFGCPSWDRLMKALAEKQQANPDFKVMLTYGGEFRFHLNPKTAGESIPKAWSSTDLKAALKEYGVDAQVASYIRVPDRGVLHTKSFIFDGRVGILGSANLTDTHSKEVMVKVRGPVVESFLADFEDAWRSSQHRFQVIGGKVDEAVGKDDLWKVTRGPAERSTQPMVPLSFLTKPEGDHVADSNQALLAALGGAQKEIKLFSPNFNVDEVWDSLVAASERGVKVKIMLPKDFNNLRAAVDGGNNYQFLVRDWGQLPKDLRDNIEVRWYSADGKTFGPATNHIKYASVDDQWTYVGSQNFDNQAWKQSREAGLGIDDATQTRRLSKDLFDDDWARSKPVDDPKPADSAWRRLIQCKLGL